MNEEIIGIEVSGEIYPIKDEETSGKIQTLETKVSTAEGNITNLEEEIKELTGLIDDTITSDVKTWSSEKINDSLINLESLIDAAYTTEEKVCGKWIDNKPAYEKTFVLTRAGVFNHNIENLKGIISVTGAIETTTVGIWEPIGTYATANNHAYISDITATQAKLTATGWGVRTANITFRYTKTTD